eukprot:2753001-Prymnesium_polylepis.1
MAYAACPRTRCEKSAQACIDDQREHGHVLYINWEWVGGGHVPCAGRSQQRAVFTAGKGERV